MDKSQIMYNQDKEKFTLTCNQCESNNTTVFRDTVCYSTLTGCDEDFYLRCKDCNNTVNIWTE